jgi:Na+-translocating ferredoxin:NAD+ oxidoreductase RNF subunit RnfB
MAVNKDKIREIFEVLPNLNCGFCGFGSCGQFARAVAERRASPFGCKQNPWSGYRISEIIGVEVPAHGYGFQPAPFSHRESTPSPDTLKALREEVKGLSQAVDNILVRIENLNAIGQDVEQAYKRGKSGKGIARRG